jgi:hypothetical protein
MYHSKILNRIKLNYFLKFVGHKLNFEIIKSEMLMLTGKENADVDGLYARCYRLLLKCC